MKKFLAITGEYSPVFLCALYGIPGLISICTYNRIRFVPSNQYIYAAVLIFITLLCALAAIKTAVPKPSKQKHYFACILPSFVLIYFSDYPFAVTNQPVAYLTMTICLLLSLYMFFKCAEGNGTRVAFGLVASLIFVFCVTIWIPPILYPTSQTVTIVQKDYSTKGEVAITTHTRIFGSQTRTDVKVYQCAPFSLGLGRYEALYSTEEASAYTEIRPNAKLVPVTVKWDGSTLFVNNVKTNYMP